jgi:hypothetical protein
MMRTLPDHGLPLVQLKGTAPGPGRRVAKPQWPVGGWELMQIAAIQQAIQAFEEVIADLDAELEAAAEGRWLRLTSGRLPNGKVVGHQHP